MKNPGYSYDMNPTSSTTDLVKDEVRQPSMVRVVLVVLLVIAVVLAIVFIALYAKEKSDNDDDTPQPSQASNQCSTASCVRNANRKLHYTCLARDSPLIVSPP